MVSIDRRGLFRAAGAVGVGAVIGPALSGSSYAATERALSQADFLDQNPSWRVKPFALDQVTLQDGTVFAQKRDRVLTFAAAYPADRVLHNFRVTAGLPTPAGSSPPGGWDDATGNLRGHYSGHLITLFAQAYASTRQAVFRDKVDYIVTELGKCQDALAASGLYSHPGFLAAYPETQFVRLESFATYPTIWAPYYTCHKIMRGLLDAYLLVGNDQALDIVTKMGDWVHSRLSVLPRETLNRMWAIYIAGEYGAMNEVMADLHAITGDERYLVAAKCFDNRQSLFGATVEDRDVLTRLHANTHVPQFLGYLRVFDQSEEAEYYTAAENFWHMVVPHRMYAHGGTSGTWPATPDLAANTNAELFQPRGNIANSIAGNGAETCTTYNLLKVARNLFFHDPDPTYMDYYERGLLNHILGSRRDTESTTSPNVTYFLPLTPGSVRGFGNTGTCCGGTGLENHTKYQESIYFRSAENDALYVNLYVGSTLNWAARGFTITQVTDFPRQEESTLTVTGEGWLDIHLRIPSWATGFRVSVNGSERGGPMTPGTYLRLRRRWHTGDTIHVSLPFRLRVEKALDRPDTQTIFNGPIVLPALSTDPAYREFSLYKDVKLDGGLGHAITPGGDGTFTTNGHTLRPLYVGDTQAQHIYFRRHEPTVVFGTHDSGVPNRAAADGTTLLDAVWAAAPFPDHDRFVGEVRRVSIRWADEGRLSRAEREAVMSAALAARDDLRID
ncbi:glycoside hydrolase family 127 protein [Phytohabitans sp. ZYX-F-186]|uniref:Glycoside hydrolase family 127 protein n=1 Tax=Phytohabitans maris TaxID=3071409 RepID=A0ABU0ZF56_9ACTN|nr:beta-L-arabinofuranosidase domain-containing protein [Phytohabitans sp. ZYX-F-186]MDQ7905682.1 glycoside hydrolase family 127 protein [Phytohabitans sp. ZYX-F-186]